MAPYLTAAETAAAEIEMPEEKLRELAEVAGLWLQAGRKDRVIEVLSAARNIAETVESRDWRDYWLVQIAQFFFQADSRELAERTLELIQDKYFFALCLRRFAEIKRTGGETAEALEDLEEALALLVSQKSMEIRDSKARYELLSAVSGEIAACGKAERALETASAIEFDDARNRAFESIAIVCASQQNEPAGKQALQAIEEDWIKAEALIGISDVHRNRGEAEQALQFLDEAHALSEEIPQLQMRSGALRGIAERYHALGDGEKTSAAMLEDLQIIERILDDYLRASTLLQAWDKYHPLELTLGDKEKEVLNKMVTRALRV
jgi:tetratricopeptide (TPR) repeat protein